MRQRASLVSIAVIAALAPSSALAHGAAPEPSAWNFLTRWEFDPIFILITGFSLWMYFSAVRQVNRVHVRSPWARKRSVYFVSGVAVMVFAVASPPASYDTTLFSVHMVQHLLLTMVAAPLMLLGTPITLALRAAAPDVRKRVLLPFLHSSFVRAVTFPVFPWLLFTFVLWGSHFTPLYNDALDHVWLHRVEHVAYLGAALLFWWEVIGIDPTPWRMHHAVRALYVFLAMPLNSWLAVSIYSSDHVLYGHYESLVRTWGPAPLLDQQLAGVVMWVFGDMMFLITLGAIIAAWVKQDERDAKRQDRELARQRAMSRPTA